jgi:hypothetical protein
MVGQRSNAGPRLREELPMLRRIVLLVTTLLIATTSTALAQDLTPGDRTGEWATAANDPITVGAGESLSTVIGISNQVRIDGVVDDFLLLIDGDVTINGAVQEILVIRGTVTLGPTAQVGNVALFRSEIVQEPGSIVTGSIESRSTVFFLEWWNSPIFALIAWLILTLFMVAGGLVFALAAGRQVHDLAQAPSSHILANIVTAVIIWCALPTLGVIVMLTIIGIPLGLVIFGLVLPGVWWLGYTVIGARLGLTILFLANGRKRTNHAVLATFVGLLVLQLTSLVPYVGGTIIFWSGVYGSGALLYHVTRDRRDRPIDPELAAYGGPELVSR